MTTVAEFIKALHEYPQDIDVLVEDRVNRFLVPPHVELIDGSIVGAPPALLIVPPSDEQPCWIDEFEDVFGDKRRRRLQVVRED